MSLYKVRQKINNEQYRIDHWSIITSKTRLPPWLHWKLLGYRDIPSTADNTPSFQRRISKRLKFNIVPFRSSFTTNQTNSPRTSSSKYPFCLSTSSNKTYKAIYHQVNWRNSSWRYIFPYFLHPLSLIFPDLNPLDITIRPSQQRKRTTQKSSYQGDESSSHAVLISWYAFRASRNFRRYQSAFRRLQPATIPVNFFADQATSDDTS